MLAIHLMTLVSFRAYHVLSATTRRQRVWFLLYLFFLSVVLFHLAAGAQLRKAVPVFLKNFPQITLEKGHLTAPQHLVYAPLPGGPFKLAFDASRTTPPTAQELLNQQILFFMTQDALYAPGKRGVRNQPLPDTFTFTTTPEVLSAYQSTLLSALQAVAFFFSLFFIPILFVMGFCIACIVGTAFNLMHGQPVSMSVVRTWAFFMLGPLCVLGYVRLWVHIPFFMLAQVILCIIYMQQIFNTLPEDSHAH